MKNILYTGLTLLLAAGLGIAQTPAWEEDYSFKALADMAGGDQIQMNITNTGSDILDCIKKAKAQALFTIIFKGYSATGSASASTSLSDMKKYNQNLDFFKNYLSSNTAGLAFVSEAKTDTGTPSGKISKKVIRSTTTVKILKTKLREDLQEQGYVESAASIAESLGIIPKIMIIPSNTWMKRAGFHKQVASNLGMVDQYDYQNALSDPSMGIFQTIEGYLKQPLQKNGFEIANLSAQLTQITQENARNSMRETQIEESDLDLLAKQCGANIWLHVSVLTEKVDGGMSKQYQITLNGVDPMTMTDVINGEPKIVKSSGDNDMVMIRTTVNAAIDNFIPEVTAYFKKRDEIGLPIKVTFLKGDGLSFDFGANVTVKGRPYPMAKLMDGVMNKVAEKSSPSGGATKTRRDYDAVIPTKVEDFISGKIVANNAESFAYDVTTALAEFGITAGVEVEPVGLGKVFVIFKEDW